MQDNTIQLYGRIKAKENSGNNMQVDFLRYLDTKKTEYQSRHSIKNKGFICYFSLEPIGLSVNEKFYVAKGNKSRILVCHNKIWVDLTDYDIIDVICKLDESDARKFLDGFKSCYSGKWTEFSFKIKDTEFKGKGLNYSEYDLQKKIYLDADFEITFGEFLFVINMVLYKDIIGERYLKQETKLRLVEKTLIKYISLISYYKFSEVNMRNYLETIKYPCFERTQLLSKKMKVKKYDEKFLKNEFDKVLAL